MIFVSESFRGVEGARHDRQRGLPGAYGERLAARFGALNEGYEVRNGAAQCSFCFSKRGLNNALFNNKR